MRIEQRTHSDTESLRIRLEGAYDVVQAATSRYQALDVLLTARGWRKSLRLTPDVLEDLRRLEGPVRDARGKCERFVAGGAELSEPVTTLLSQLSSARAALHQTVLRRLRARTTVPLEDAVRQLGARVLAEIPGELRPQETRLMEGGAKFAGMISVTVLLWLGLLMSGPLVTLVASEGPPSEATVTLAAISAGVVLVCWLPFLISWLVAGRYVLTNQRLFWTPRLGEGVQVELSTLNPGAFKLTPLLRWIKVDALEPFTMRSVQDAARLAAYAESIRWMSARPSTEAPLTEVAIFPAFAGEKAYDESQAAELRESGIGVMRPAWAGFFRLQNAHTAVEAITGYCPGKGVDLEAALQTLKRLGPTQFDEAVKAAAVKTGLLFERPAATVKSTAPIWNELVITGPAGAFASKITWRHLEQVDAMVGLWRTP